MADFDPDAYLREDFDPDRYLAGAAPPPPAKPKPSLLEASARAVKQGFSGLWGDEGAGAIAAALPFLDREAAGSGATFGERYQHARDFYRGLDNAAREAHPRAFTAGEIAGGLAPAILLPQAVAAKGAGLGTKMAIGAGNGAAMGAAMGAGGSTDNTARGLAVDTGVGALGGALTGAASPLAAKLVAPILHPVEQAASRGLQWGADKLKGAAITQGRKALSGIGTALSARKPIAENAVREAYENGAIRPLSTVEGIAGRLENAAEPLGDQYHQILENLAAKGVTGPNAQKLAAQLSADAQAASATSLGSPRPGTLQNVADELLTKPTANEAGDLGLLQAEAMKRQLQDEARREYDKISRQYTTGGETKKELASKMRQAIEDAVTDQATKAPADAKAFQPVKAKLARTLEALKAAEEGAARAARRKPISLTSTIVGSAAGAHSGNPIIGALAAGAHSFVDHRLPSTIGSLAYGGSNVLDALASRGVPPPAAMSLTPEAAALIDALRRRAAVGLVPAAAEDDRGR